MASHFSSSSADGGDVYRDEMTAFSHGCVQMLAQCCLGSLDSSVSGNAVGSWTVHIKCHTADLSAWDLLQ